MKIPRLILLAAAALTTAASAQAALYWDAGTVTVDGISAGGTGTWTVGAAGWEDGTSAQNWTDGNLAVFGGGASTITVGGNISATGLRFVNTGAYTLTGTARTLSIGTSGIDMSAAAADVNFGANMTIAVGGNSQTWNVATGRTLSLSSVGLNGTLTGTNAATITVAGGGLVDLLPTATGATNYLGNWLIQGGSTLRSTRNQAAALGTGVVTLNGGTLAVGGVAGSGAQGNWTFNNAIKLGTAGTNYIDNQLPTGGTGSGTRWLKLDSVISNSSDAAGLTFKNTQFANGVMTSDENGFILAAANTFTGNLGISANTFVRIGGQAAGTLNANAGNSGSIASSVAITNDGVLRLTRNDAWTFANAMSGTGQLKIGGTAGTTTGQVVTVSGTNTYTGATTVVNGRMNLTGSLTSAVNVTGGSISGTGSTTGLLTFNGTGVTLALAGGATTTSLTSNGVTFSAATAASFLTTPTAATTYDVLTYGAGVVTNPGNLSVNAHGTLANTGTKFTFVADGAQSRTWNTATGTWVNGGATWIEGDNKYYDLDSVIFNEPASASVITLAGRLAPAAVTVNNTTNKITFTGVNGTADITGTGSLTKSGTGTLEITTQQSYTGGTSIDGGVLSLTSGGASGTIRGIVNVNAGGTLSLGAGDSLGYNNDATAVNAVYLNGGTMTSAAGSNQTTTAKFYMTGGTINGTVNLDLFSNNSSVTTYASSNESTISVTTMNLRQNDTVFDIADGAAARDLVISSAIGNGLAGNHNMIKNGAGTMVLTGTNTFTGNVTVNAGVLDLTSGKLYSSAFNNTNVVTVNTGGTLKLNSFGYSANASLGQLADYGIRRVINGGTIEVAAATESVGNNFSVGANGGTFRYKPADTANTLTLSGNGNSNIAVGGALTFDTAGNVIVQEVIEGTGSLAKTGSQTLTLSGANNYAGGTTVNVGTLKAGSAGAFGSGAVTVNGGSLDLNGQAVTNSVTLAGGTFQGGSGYTGTISGSAGTFLAGTDAAKSYSINAAGVSFTNLSGQGTFSGGVVTVTGTHAVGNSPGAQSFDTGLTYADGATVALEFDNLIASSGVGGTNWDTITVNGGLIIGTGVNLTWTGFNDVNAVDYTGAEWDTSFSKTLISADAITGSFNPFSDFAVDGQGTWSIAQNGNNIEATWTAVPEPSTYGLIGAGALAAVAFVRRRRKFAGLAA